MIFLLLLLRSARLEIVPPPSTKRAGEKATATTAERIPGWRTRRELVVAGMTTAAVEGGKGGRGKKAKAESSPSCVLEMMRGDEVDLV